MTPQAAVPHRLFLFAVAAHANGNVDYELIAEQEVLTDADNVDYHRLAMMPWAAAHMSSRLFDAGLYCAQFSPMGEDGVPLKSLASRYFTWGGIGAALPADG